MIAWYGITNERWGEMEIKSSPPRSTPKATQYIIERGVLKSRGPTHYLIKSVLSESSGVEGIDRGGDN